MFLGNGRQWSISSGFRRMLMMMLALTLNTKLLAKLSTVSHSTQNGQQMTSQTLNQAKNSSQGNISAPPVLEASGGLSVLYFLDHVQGQSVYINGGRAQGIPPGATLHAIRPLPERSGTMHLATVITGVLKVIQLGEQFAIAKIIRNSTRESASNFRDYPEVMAGDLIKIPAYRIISKIHSLPKWKRSYFDLFKAPGPVPSTFELTEEGKEILREELSVFLGKHIARLFVRGHTDTRGASSANQVESLQRALTVRQFLIEDLGIDPSRITALGLGESDLMNHSKVFGANRENRRIEITAAIGDSDA